MSKDDLLKRIEALSQAPVAPSDRPVTEQELSSFKKSVAAILREIIDLL